MTHNFSHRRRSVLLLCLTICITVLYAEQSSADLFPVHDQAEPSIPLSERASRLLAKHAGKLNGPNTWRNSPPVIDWRWAPGKFIKVFFVQSQFNEAEQKTLREAIGNWNSVSRELGTGVYFLISGEAQTVSNSPDTLTLARSDPNVTNPDVLAYFRPLRRSKTGFITSGVINFNPRTHEQRALLSFMAHEMGHGFGLGDCPRCKETAMRFFPGPNHDNGFLSPTEADKETIRWIYTASNSLPR